ncbi:MAG: endonuclease domain-containing protein [Acidimicrobiia bacterium]
MTTPARTLVDLGAVLPLGSVSRALDRVIGRKLATLAEVRAAMDAVARKGRAGVGVIRRLLTERGDAPGGTVLETRMSALLRTNGVPTPIAQHTVLDEHGQFVGCVDFAYPEVRYAIEVDGYEFHSGLREFGHDRVRQNDLVDLGWTVHRFTWSEVDHLSARVADRIRQRRLQLLGTLRHATGA